MLILKQIGSWLNLNENPRKVREGNSNGGRLNIKVCSMDSVLSKYISDVYCASCVGPARGGVRECRAYGARFVAR